MNVLILTPDRVGSTLLQRLLTIYMNMQNFDQPVINLHELTNGLIKYFNPRFNREVLGKPNGGWGYYQTLSEIVDLLKSTEHYKTSRLALYHIVNRQDSMGDQLSFYQYLNDNFFIISARRENLLEHALSWCIQLHSKKLNVFSHSEKISIFSDLYQNKITIEDESLIKYLDQYVKYLQWVDNHFQVGSYFKYERDMPNIENYILNLPVFNQKPQLTWKDTFGIDWKDWNQCHYLLSDLSGLSQQIQSNQLLLEHNTTSINDYKLMPSNSTTGVLQHLSGADQTFLLEKQQSYKTVHQAITELVQDKVLVTGVPIKLQTLAEKKLLIKNFDHCVSVYNNWAACNNQNQYLDTHAFNDSIQRELTAWHQTFKLT